MASYVFLYLSLALLLVVPGYTLEVTPGSSCATFCLNLANDDGFDPDASFTNSSEITCRDLDFSTRDTGIKFKSCLECLQKSDKVNETESDVHWFLYNLRYTLSTCLFSFPNELPNAIQSPCIIDYACGSLREPLAAGELDPEDNDTYGYCSANDGVFSRRMQWCVNCLRASSDQNYLSNFVVALQGGCEQTPEPGTPIGLSGTIFSSEPVNVTEPPEDIMERPEGAGSGTMTTGTIVGIGVGVGLLLLGAIALFIVYWRRQKRLRNAEKNEFYGQHSSTPDPFLPPEGGVMSASLRTHSGQSNYNKEAIVTSGEYYDKVEEDMRAGKLNYNFDPRSTSRGPNSAFPAHQAYIPQAVSRASMNPNAGSHARTRSNPPSSYAMSTYVPSAEPLPATSLQPPPATHVHESSQRRAPPAKVPPPPAHPPAPKISVPSLFLPSLGKLRQPKKYSPPTLSGPTRTSSGDEEERPELKISQPVMNANERFHDRPLGGGVVYATDATGIEANQDISPERAEVPMKSGQSALYGF